MPKLYLLLLLSCVLVSYCYSETTHIDSLTVKAKLGNAQAQVDLGLCYWKGNGTDVNYDLAIEWFRKSAAQNFASGEFALGGCYYKGEGVEESRVEAINWFKKAAEHGDMYAQATLAECYEDTDEGNEGFFDMKEAIKWRLKAADNGHPQSQYYLGLWYNLGENVPQSAKESYYWWLLAYEAGNEFVLESIETVIDHLTPVEKKEAENKVTKWFATHHADLVYKFPK